MNFFKTFLLVLLTSFLAIAKTGYAAASDVQSAAQDIDNVSNTNDLSNQTSFETSHQPLGNHLLDFDLEEEEEEDSEKKRLSQLLPCSISFESTLDFTPNLMGCTCTIKGISEMQSIRLHLIIQKFQI
ncbi:MAG: hypothetical protein HWE22_16835 [Flavobacteriales bacterium]|nr:hypothetical protein [Flavobacteriales bacterium]